MRELAPIVLFGYNRPDHMRKTLEHLARADGASDSPLWIFCDGPKPGSDSDLVEAVSALANDREWARCFASIRIHTSTTNKGLANSIISGVSTVMNHAGRAIVVEDDLLVAPDFLHFMNDCLQFYKDDQSVGSVTGFSPVVAPPSDYPHDVMAVTRNCSHSWATWADRWAEVDWDAGDAVRLWSDASLRRRFNAAGNDRLERLRRQLDGKIDSWSIRFGLWQTLSGRHTIYPVHNRVKNIGFDGSGVHTRAGEDLNCEVLNEARAYKLETVSEDPAIAREVAKVYAGPLWRRTLRLLHSRVRNVYLRGHNVTLE